eukprot:Tamp_09742.p2 GENE.Tamp_09742~~Tamp_09742.p2  ORF type:complete len:152 (-),score=22.93 Tamp_09742:1040-1495(-)
MKTTTSMLAKFERHATFSMQEGSVAFAVFCSTFVNTALVALVVYGNLSSPAVAKALGGYIFGGPHEDFNVDWYRVVGSQLTLSILTILVQPLVPLLGGLLKRAVVSCQCLPLPLMQADLNKAVLGDEFLLSTRYGMLMVGGGVDCTCYLRA